MSAGVSAIAMAFSVVALYVPLRWVPVPIIGFVALVFTLVRNPVGRYFRLALSVLGLWCAIVLKPSLNLKIAFEDNFSIWGNTGHAEWYVHLILAFLLTIFISLDYLSRKSTKAITKNGLAKYRYELSLVAFLSILVTTIALSSIAADVAKTEIKLSRVTPTSEQLVLLEKNTAQTLAGVSDKELEVGRKNDSLVNFSLYLEHIESLGYVAVNPTSGTGLGVPGTLVHIDRDGVLQFIARSESVFPGLPIAISSTTIPQLKYTTGDDGLNLNFRAGFGRITRSSQLDILKYLDSKIIRSLPEAIKNLELLVVSSSLEGGSLALEIQGRLRDEIKFYAIDSEDPIVVGLQFYKLSAFSKQK